MKKFLAILVACLFVFAACGSDDDSPADDVSDADEDVVESDDETDGDETDGDETDVDETDVDVADGDCPLLPVSAVVDAAGVAADDVQVLAASEQSCSFTVNEVATFSVDYLELALPTDEYADGVRDTCDEGTIVEVDAGEQAFACQAYGPFGAVYEDGVSVSIGAGGGDDEDAIVALIAELLPSLNL